MEDELDPTQAIKHLVVHVDAREKLDPLTDHDYLARDLQTYKPAKQQKKEFYVASITQLKALYNCTKCGFRTIRSDMLKEHMDTHRNQPLFKPHISNEKTIKIPDGYVKCLKCSYYTKKMSSLKVHMRIHYKEAPYNCTDCPFSGKDLKELIKHYSETKDLKCQLCEYSTHVRQQMATHDRVHTGEKPFVCGVCNFTASDRSNLYRHMRIHMP